MPQFLTTKQLSERWQINQDTLRQWRVSQIGPAYVKLGDGRGAPVRYRSEDIEKFEQENKLG